MIAWCWLIAAFILGSVVATFTWNYFDYDNLFTNILEGVTVVVIYPFMLPLHFFWCVFRPVSQETWNKFVANNPESKIFRICGKLYFCFDSKAGHWFQKAFLVRLKGEDKNEN